MQKVAYAFAVQHILVLLFLTREFVTFESAVRTAAAKQNKTYENR